MKTLIWFLVFLLTIQTTFAGVMQPRNKSQKDSSCYDSNAVPHIGQIPDSGTCRRYLKCTEIDEDDSPIAVPTRCPNSLVYDIHSCNCQLQEQAVCFDPLNPDHEPIRFKCAEPLEEDRKN